MTTKQPAHSPPQKPRNVRALKKCYVGDVLRERGAVFVHRGELGTILKEVGADAIPDPEVLMDALVKGKPLVRTQRSGTHQEETDDDDGDDEFEDATEGDGDGKSDRK